MLKTQCFSFLFLILCIQVLFDDPNNILKTQREWQVHQVQLKGPFLAYGVWRLWSRQTVKHPLLWCILFFNVIFSIFCIQVWFDDPNSMLKTQRIRASPSCSDEIPVFGLWWIKSSKPSDGKKKNPLLRCSLFSGFLFLIRCIQVWVGDPNNILKTQRVMTSPSKSTERTIFGLWCINALKLSDGKTSTIMKYPIF